MLSKKDKDQDVEETPKSFKEKLVEEIKGLDDPKGLEFLDDKIEKVDGHIELERTELQGLEASYETEKQKQADKVDAIREKLFDVSAGELLNQLQTISLPAQKRHLVDGIEKLQTNLLGLGMQKKDLLLVKRALEEKIKKDLEIVEAKKLFSMLQDLIGQYQEVESSFNSFKNHIGAASNEHWALKIQDFWQEAGMSKALMETLLAIGDSHLRSAQLPSLSLVAFIEACAGVASSHSPNPLSLMKDISRQTGAMRWIGSEEPPQQSFERTEAEGDRAAEARLQEIFNE